VIEQLLHEAQAMPVVKGGRADSWGEEQLQLSQSKPPAAVSQRPPLAAATSRPSAGHRGQKAPEGPSVPTRSLEFTVSSAERSPALVFELRGPSSAAPA